jgi:hypothetical protein
MTPEEESLILRGRRLVPDESGDDYFQFIAGELRKGGNVFAAVKSGIAMFGARSKCEGCS